MIDEDTGEEPRCVICNSSEACEHFLACIDRTFGEIEGGALYDSSDAFRSAIENAFLKVLKSGVERKWKDYKIKEMWDEVRAEYTAEDEFVMLDDNAFCALLLELLRDSGAINYSGQAASYGGPGMSSAYSLLYADKPDDVITKALEKLKTMLA